MAQLSKILGAILHDMATAQHEARRYARSLAAARDQTTSSDTSVPPPAICLGETELTLRCGFTGDFVTESDFEIDETALRHTLRKLAADMSDAVVSGILAIIARRTESLNAAKGPVARLNREKPLRRNFITFIENRLYEQLIRQRPSYLAEDGTFDTDALRDVILHIADTGVLSHPDLAYAFSDGTATELRENILENLRTDLRDSLPRLLKDQTVGHTGKRDSIDLIVDTKTLARLPEACLQTLRLKIIPYELPENRPE